MSGWPSGLRRCVQVAVSPGGVGSNPTSDKTLFLKQLIQRNAVAPVLNKQHHIRMASRNSSVGRALDWRSKGPWFDPGFRHNFYTATTVWLWSSPTKDLKTVASGSLLDTQHLRNPTSGGNVYLPPNLAQICVFGNTTIESNLWIP